MPTHDEREFLPYPTERVQDNRGPQTAEDVEQIARRVTDRIGTELGIAKLSAYQRRVVEHIIKQEVER